MEKLKGKLSDRWKSFRIRTHNHVKLKKLSWFYGIKMSKIIENYIEEEYEKNREAMRKAI